MNQIKWWVHESRNFEKRVISPSGRSGINIASVKRQRYFDTNQIDQLLRKRSHQMIINSNILNLNAKMGSN